MAQIGVVSRKLCISIDTLRYYEKMKLLPSIARDPAGQRNYSEKDVSRLNFIKRAQRMGFSLSEIAELLEFRNAPQQAKPNIQRMAQEKLAAIEEQLSELQILQLELQRLTSLCDASNGACPIIDGLENG